jgi:BlaR1 peptidase M56
MPDVVDRMGAALLDASLAATAIAGLVVLAMIQCRQPARRRDWARAGLLSTLALLPLAALNPVPRIDLRGTLRALLPTNLDDPSPRPRAEGRDACEPPIGRLGEGNCPRGQADSSRPPGLIGWPRQVARGIVIAYLVGVSIGLGWIAVGFFGATWLVGRGYPPSAKALAHHRSLPFEGGSRRPRLLVSDRSTRPVLMGLLRPVILIPPGLDETGPTDRLRLSLLHELAHAESLDHRFTTAATLAQAVWFFLPPVWWIRDQMKLDQEFLADRRAVEHFGTSGGYASSLVDLANPVEPDPDPSGPSSKARGTSSKGAGMASALFQRVVMLLKCPFALEGRTPLWWRWSTAATLALATLAASCLTLRGLAGWSTPPLAPTEQPVRSFRLPNLTIGQHEHDDQPFDLRFRLPDRFTLTFEVMAEPADLPGIEVLGHKLGEASNLNPSPSGYRLWHRVRITRAEGSEIVEVDGWPPSKGPGHTKLSPWLTIRPSPGRTTRVRDLSLDW